MDNTIGSNAKNEVRPVIRVSFVSQNTGGRRVYFKADDARGRLMTFGFPFQSSEDHPSRIAGVPLRFSIDPPESDERREETRD